MKKLSVFQISLLAAFAAFAVVGVLVFAFAVGGGNAQSVGPITIWGTLDATAFNAVIRQAADNDPSLSQVTYVQKDPSTFQSDLTQALASGKGPDLFLMTQDEVVQDSGAIVEIPFTVVSQTQFENTFVDAASPFISQNGIVGFPLLVDPLVLYWNKDMLASAGYTQPPEYWDSQIYDMAQRITQKDASGNIVKSLIAFGGYRNIDDAKDILAMLIMQAGGTITAYDSSGRLIANLVSKTPNVPQGSTELALTFYTSFADPSLANYSWNASLPMASQAFEAGQLALYIGYASEAPTIAKANPNLNVGIAVIPQPPTATSTIDAARVYALAATRTGANPNAALTVAAALATAANSSAFSTVYGLPSARRDVLAAATSQQNLPAVVSSTDIASGTDPVIYSATIARSWIDPDPAATASLFQDMIENTTSGALSASEAVQRADQQLTQIISQQLQQP